ncbi:MDR family MFS transporter [Pseudolysinimonas kribbensis]|uniref:MDR family MFS transporter n=1 Tax=Pseudolysinimonas kribbensis TaxID=433641 RepID=UPI003CD0B72D
MRVARSEVGLRSERGPILLGAMTSTALIAIDSTILATAVPSVVKDLGGFSQFPWLFSIYLLAQAVLVPVYSKLADMVGRKPIMIFGILLFLVGSVLCGAAWNMTALIVFRAVQGLGAGAVQPMSMTIIGDIYTVEERARVQGYVASIWGMASVVGPALGGVFSQFLTWRWIFFVNVPVCILALVLIARGYHETVAHRRHRIDVPGAVLLTVGSSSVILGLLEGGEGWPWLSVPGVAVFVVGILALVGFVLVERRAAEPVLSLEVLSRRVVLTAALVAGAVGAATIGLSSYVPTYLQRTLGTSPIVSGLAVAALTLGWPIAAALAGRLYLRYGFRTTCLVGILVSTTGAITLAAVGMTPSLIAVMIACFVTGWGFGWCVSPALVAAQSSVMWNERGVVTGVQAFGRSIGSAVGAAVLGAVANAVIAISGRGSSDPHAVTVASTWVFVAVAVFVALTIATVLRMPRLPPPKRDPITGSIQTIEPAA